MQSYEGDITYVRSYCIYCNFFVELPNNIMTFYCDRAGEYHCWLQMDTTLMIGQYVPIVVLAVLTLTLIEAAGAAEYRKLPGIDQRQQTSAKIMQRSNLIIMPLIFASFTVGTLATYEQNPGLYGTVTLINGILGGAIFFFHSTGNERVSVLSVKILDNIIRLPWHCVTKIHISDEMCSF